MNLENQKKTWLVTGVGGFIGSNLLESLLQNGQIVIGLDDFATGYQKNIDEALSSVDTVYRSNFRLLTGDIREIADLNTCFSIESMDWLSEKTNVVDRSIDIVLHQAALGSVPRSMEDPVTTNAVNISGFLNLLNKSAQQNVKRFVYAASSSTYGDHPAIPKREDNIGKPLSPYAVTKLCNELYAEVFNRSFNLECIGLRYFNVFGRRQDPNGAYAAVIPKWIKSMLIGEEVVIHGDGETTRDFCYVDNVVQANLRAALCEWPKCEQAVFNIAYGEQTSLNELYEYLATRISNSIDISIKPPKYIDFRIGDVRHSLADVSKAKRHINYNPTHNLKQGLKESLPWYLEEFADGG